MDHGGFAGRVAIRALFTQRAHSQAGHRCRNQHPAGVRLLGPAPKRGRLLQQGREQADRVEDGLDVEVKDLAKGAVGVRVKGLAPGGPGVGEEDVDAVRVPLDAVEQGLDPVDGGAVGGHRDGPGPWRQVGQRVEQGDGRVARGGFAGRDEDFGAACLEEATRMARKGKFTQDVNRLGKKRYHSR